MADPSTIPDKTSEYLHSKLPIGKEEKILAVYRHHWFAYVSVWVVAGLIILAVLGTSVGLVATSDPASTTYQHRDAILGLAAIFCVLVGFFSFIPVWLKTQEQVVLTEEALLQILQPSLFASKISQLSLQHIADVSVRQDFFGSMLGFGKISVETPGEQDNYEFFMIPDPQNTAKTIIEAHENFSAALESGRIATTLGTPAQPQAPQIDPQQFQEFIAFQQAEEAMKEQAAAAAQPQQTTAAEPVQQPAPTMQSPAWPQQPATTDQDQAQTAMQPQGTPQQPQAYEEPADQDQPRQ